MNNLYLITGPAGVGKSTVSMEIAKSYNKSALIEGDDISSSCWWLCSSLEKRKSYTNILESLLKYY